MKSILKRRISGVFECESNSQTFEQYANELADTAKIKREDMTKMSNNEILEYIDYLSLAIITMEI